MNNQRLGSSLLFCVLLPCSLVGAQSESMSGRRIVIPGLAKDVEGSERSYLFVWDW